MQEFLSLQKVLVLVPLNPYHKKSCNIVWIQKKEGCPTATTGASLLWLAESRFIWPKFAFIFSFIALICSMQVCNTLLTLSKRELVRLIKVGRSNFIFDLSICLLYFRLLSFRSWYHRCYSMLLKVPRGEGPSKDWFQGQLGLRGLNQRWIFLRKTNISSRTPKMALHENPGAPGSWPVIFLHEAQKRQFFCT